MANKKPKSKITQAQMKRLFKEHKIRKCHVKLERLSMAMLDDKVMAIKKPKSKITQAQMKKLFKEHKIRKFQINLDRLNIDCSIFRKTLFNKHGIRDIAGASLKLLPSKGNLRSQVSWLPISSSVLTNSIGALSTLAVYREKNSIVTPVARKNVRRQRAKSMFENRANDDDQSNDINGMNYSMDDMHSELQEKFNSPNLGLKSSRDRPIGQKPQQPLSEWQKLHAEFKKRVELKLAKK